MPHLLPINRGIISTIYAPLAKPLPQDAAVALYREFYAGERFVRVLGSGETANLRQVRCSNFCDISVHVDARTDTLVLVSEHEPALFPAGGNRPHRSARAVLIAPHAPPAFQKDRQILRQQTERI